MNNKRIVINNALNNQFSGEEKHRCTICNKYFSCLRKHKRVHKAEKQYQCTTCNKYLSCSDSLRRHKKIHKAEKPYQCSTCGKEFSDNSNYKKHTSIHTNNRPYTCLICNKQFRLNQYLTLHNMRHSCENSYQPIISDKNSIPIQNIQQNSCDYQFNEKNNYVMPIFTYTPLEVLPFTLDIQPNLAGQTQLLLDKY